MKTESLPVTVHSSVGLWGNQHKGPCERVPKIHGTRKLVDVEKRDGCGGVDQSLACELRGLVEQQEDVA
jgi:hypothetical protein